MANFISIQPKDNFNTVLYTGNASARDVGGVGFEPNMVWIKGRTTSENHHLFDSARGATYRLYPNLANAESAISTTLDEFQADGFGIGGADDGVNQNTIPFVSWSWKGGTTSAPAGSTVGLQAVSINADAGIGIYKYNAAYPAGKVIKHGLGRIPEFLMVKNYGGSHDWACYHSRIIASSSRSDYSQAGDYFIRLNTTAAKSDNSGYFHDTLTTATDITLASDNPVGGDGQTCVLYAFCNVPGFSRFGTYMGNADADGQYIPLGFKPAMVIIKRSDGSDGWNMWDNKRNLNNVRNKYLEPDYAGPEVTGTTDHVVDFLSNGFKIRGSGSETNTNGGSYIFMAWAAEPLVSSNSKPSTAA
jgi:hypothetical protein|tara:strand:+ start:1691 stop:2767 length:1077 start_codon:yes stop_codon:yes gene_type:complete